MITAALAPEVILIAGDFVAGAWDRMSPIIEKQLSTSTLAGLKPKLLPTHEAEVARLRGAGILVLQRRSTAAEPSDSKRAARAVPMNRRMPVTRNAATIGAIVT
jgi:hypothetical protein